MTRSRRRRAPAVPSSTATSILCRVHHTTRWTGEPRHRKCPVRPPVRLYPHSTCLWVPAGVAIKPVWRLQQAPCRLMEAPRISLDYPVPATRTKARRTSTSSRLLWRRTTWRRTASCSTSPSCCQTTSGRHRWSETPCWSSASRATPINIPWRRCYPIGRWCYPPRPTSTML